MKPANCPYYISPRPGMSQALGLNYNDWETSWKTGQKIALIRDVKNVIDMGLKDAKEWIEKFQDTTCSRREEAAEKSWEDICNTLNLISERDLCKEEVLELVSKANDAKGDMLFDTMGDVLEALIMNIKKKGGTKVIASEIDEVINEL